MPYSMISRQCSWARRNRSGKLASHVGMSFVGGHTRYAPGPLLRSWLHCVHSEVSACTGAPAQSVRHVRQLRTRCPPAATIPNGSISSIRPVWLASSQPVSSRAILPGLVNDRLPDVEEQRLDPWHSVQYDLRYDLSPVSWSYWAPADAGLGNHRSSRRWDQALATWSGPIMRCFRAFHAPTSSAAMFGSVAASAFS